MTSTIIALILFVCLLVTLELSLRASSKYTLELKAVRADNEGLKNALVARDKEARCHAEQARTFEHHHTVAQAALVAVCDLAEEDAAMHNGRIENLCEQLEESRKGRRHYYNESANKGERIVVLEAEVTALKLANFANLSGLAGLTALQQENKLDALCEVIKTLMQRDQLCDAAVASFGGRLSRAVQVYRKDRLKAEEDFHPQTICLIPGLAHLMA